MKIVEETFEKKTNLDLFLRLSTSQLLSGPRNSTISYLKDIDGLIKDRVWPLDLSFSSLLATRWPASSGSGVESQPKEDWQRPTASPCTVYMGTFWGPAFYGVTFLFSQLSEVRLKYFNPELYIELNFKKKFLFRIFIYQKFAQ